MAYKSKETEREYQRQYYLRNREERIETARRWNEVAVEVVRKYLVEYLSIHPCVDCGEDDILVLSFDHVRGKKKFNISESISGKRPRSLSKIKQEVKKCDIRCHNCHGRKTAVEKGFWKLQYLSHVAQSG